jgi:uncharacterized protein (TIGR00730 family)
MTKAICVFCGASDGIHPSYREKARELGKLFAKSDITLIYGGASIGVMGAIADGCLEAGGKVVGVIPGSILDLEVGHKSLTNLHIVDDMHQRKAKMYELSDAFFAIPGGMGTLDELCEIITWAQLKYHDKPCYVINENGFFDHLLKHFRHINEQGFLSDEHLGLVRERPSVESALEDLL